MLRSMTGQGQARGEGPRGALTIELRTVNNRHFKLSPRLSESLSLLEPKFEAAIRAKIRRGTVHLSAYWQRAHGPLYRIHQATLSTYYQDLQRMQEALAVETPLQLAALAMLPGAVETVSQEVVDAEELWAEVEPVLDAAVANLDAMRELEGRAMGAKLEEDLELIGRAAAAVRERSPVVVDYYRNRILNRVQSALGELASQIQPTDLIREVQVFADRCDISEELTRLSSHLAMFLRVVKEEPAAGRKLDFVIQEMFREANTIGSKANDAEIAGHVVEIKCAIERMRELVQNLE